MPVNFRSNTPIVFEEHGVGLSDGKDFGAPGYLRLNLGAHEVCWSRHWTGWNGHVLAYPKHELTKFGKSEISQA